MRQLEPSVITSHQVLNLPTGTVFFFQSFNKGTRATMTTSLRASIADPLSSPPLEHLRHGQGERTTARAKAGPRFISPLQNYHDEEDDDLNVSERTCFTSLSLESLSLSRLSESCHKSPRLPPSSPERIHDVRSMQLNGPRRRRSTTNDLPSGVLPKSHTKMTHTSSSPVETRPNGPRRRRSTTNELPSGVLPKSHTKMTHTSSSPVETRPNGPRRRRSTTNELPSGVLPKSHTKMTQTSSFPDETRPNYDHWDVAMKRWEDEHQQETTTKHQHQLLEHDGIMDDELNEMLTSMSNHSGHRNISGRTTPQSDTSTSSTRFHNKIARKNVCYGDEPTADSSATATSSRGRGIYGTTTAPGGDILVEENATTTAKPTHVGLLVRTTRNKLDESVSSLDESMRSNTNTVYPYYSKSCLAIVMDERASFISPYCVSDFESQRETTSTTTSQTSRQCNMVPSSSKRLIRSMIMRASNNYSSGDIRDTSLLVITKSRHVTASHSYKFGDNHGPDFEQHNISRRSTSYPNQKTTSIDRSKSGLHIRRRTPRRATTDCSAIRPQQQQLSKSVNNSGKGTANLHYNRQHKSEAGLYNSMRRTPRRATVDCGASRPQQQQQRSKSPDYSS